ncbi:MAG TPA: APC family permease, partial [Gemmatimonadales bacterium]|nr:APC family permease [Gemmatimonadales bacterium]
MGRWSLTALMINSIVGSSVFGLPSIVAGKLGSSSPWAWVLAAIGTGFIVACVAEVASRFGGAGGPYLYARIAFGRLVGIESGWLLYLARITAAATNANLFIILLKEFWPGASEPLTARLILALIIGGLGILNYRGVGFGAAASNVFAVAKLVPLGLFIIAGLGVAFSSHGVQPLPIPAPASTWLEAILLLVFAYGGFEGALMPLSEAKDPRRDAPFALFTALGVVTLIYTLAQFVVIHVLPDPSAPERPLSAAAGVFAGVAGAKIMGAAALVSIFGYLAGVTLNVSRLTFAMAEQNDAPAAFGRIHPQFRTPSVSLFWYCVLVWVLAASGTFLQNLTLSAISRLVIYALMCAALVQLRRRELAPAPGFTLPAGTIVAAAG